MAGDSDKVKSLAPVVRSFFHSYRIWGIAVHGQAARADSQTELQQVDVAGCGELWQICNERTTHGPVIAGTARSVISVAAVTAASAAARFASMVFRAFTSTAPAERAGHSHGFLSAEAAELERLEWEQRLEEPICDHEPEPSLGFTDRAARH